MNFAYNISPKLKAYLDRIDSLRSEILLTPLPPKVEARLKWEATIDKIYWSLSLIEENLSKKNVIDVLTRLSFNPKRKLANIEKDILNQRKALNYIREEWSVSKNTVSFDEVKKLYEIACRETLGKMSGLTEFSEKNINLFLEYLQKGHDHPVIQAGVAQIETINITPFDAGNGRVARLLSYVFLYKNGYDVGDLISFEEYMKRDVLTLRRILDLSKARENLTLWLEYFAYAVASSLEKTKVLVKNPKFQANEDSFWKLNSRQRQILEYLEKPETKITNKEVQKKYAISQITASRDLSRLASLGFLLTHGKGRSTFYIKV